MDAGRLKFVSMLFIIVAVPIKEGEILHHLVKQRDYNPAMDYARPALVLLQGNELRHQSLSLQAVTQAQSDGIGVAAPVAVWVVLRLGLLHPLSAYVPTSQLAR